MSRKPNIALVSLGDPEALNDLVLAGDDTLTLRDILARHPALSTTPLSQKVLDTPSEQLTIQVVTQPLDVPLYRPPGLQVAPVEGAGSNGRAAEPALRPSQPEGKGSKPAQNGASAPIDPPAEAELPISVSDHDAVRLAYAREIVSAASFLRSGLSVLVHCDKLVMNDLYPEIAVQAGLKADVLTVPNDGDGGLMARGLRQRQLAKLRDMIHVMGEGHVLVIPHLDLLAGGDSNLSTEARELIELTYEANNRLILAFADRSLDLPEVLTSRFAINMEIGEIHRSVIYPTGEERILGRALVTRGEAANFTGYEPEDFYKNVSGMNPIRLRDAVRYAVQEEARAGQVDVNRLYSAIRAFKAKTSSKFEVPNVKFDDIGGYDGVKLELLRAIDLINGSFNLPDPKLRGELIPRGFIFYGPPGTGKTLFAKAVANRMQATILVVSGPEVTDMYVGESERKVRDLFAAARRNAPAVLVFDEFDSIASKRSGRDDGGSRAGNALVAQMLTEMDGFRPDVPMLVIGTTNRLDIIDEALLRPSRFKPVRIDLPDVQARREIARVHAKHFHAPVNDQLIEVIARASEGLNGDDIRSLFRDVVVGMHCETPPKLPTARRYGELLGALKYAKLQQQSASARQTSAVGGSRPGQRQGPSGPTVVIGGRPAAEIPSPSLENPT
ncbi:MAG: ATP-binding protein [Capsulimonadaceae bacterium]